MEEHAKAKALGMSIISPEMQEKSEQAAADFRLHEAPASAEEDILQGHTLEEALEQAFGHAERINNAGHPAGKKPPQAPEPAD